MTSGGAATRDWYKCNLCRDIHDPSEDRSCHPYDSLRDYDWGPVPKDKPIKYKIGESK